MKSSIIVRPVNSIVFVHGERVIGEQQDKTPSAIWGAGIHATNSCLIVPCFPEVDGATKIEIDDLTVFGQLGEPNFSSALKISSGNLLITTTDGEVLLRKPIPSGMHRIKVWLENSKYPQVVKIGVESEVLRDWPKDILQLRDNATQTGWEFFATERFFACDGGIPSQIRDFDPRTSREVMAAGRMIEMRGARKIRFLNELTNDTLAHTTFDEFIATPSKWLWLFDETWRVKYKIDTGLVSHIVVWQDRKTSAETIAVVSA